MQIGKKNFDVAHHTYIMGILNVTPDSFSDGGKYCLTDQALFHTEEMIEAGADIIDVGGESTRPGYQMITEAEEIDRTAAVVEKITARFEIPVSIDTYKSQVALAALKSGADMVNDIWGLKYDSNMAAVIKKENAVCCLMHNRAGAVYNEFMPDLVGDLQETLLLSEQAGITKDKIVLDPGVGFGKTYEQNLTVISQLGQITALGYPVLLGTSRKSVIGLTLGTSVDERLEGTLVTTVYAVLQGCSFIRVHDVKENKRAVQMAEAIKAFDR